MDSFKKFYSILQEARASGDVLYHKTELSNIINILTENRINLTFSSGADERYTKGKKFFYLSCARSMTSEYIYKFLNKKDFSCVLILDGAKLSIKHQIRPLDYWGPTFGKDEMEDRVLSDKPTIENARDYIKEIRLYIPPDSNIFEDDRLRSNIKKLSDYAKTINIKMYDDLQKFVLGKGDSIESKYLRDYYKEFKERLEWLSQDIPDTLPYDYYEISSWTGFLTDIHNIKASKNPYERNQLLTLQNLVRRNKVSGITELIKKKINDYKNSKV